MSNLSLRLATAAVGIPTLLAVNKAGGYTFAVLVGAAALVSAMELTGMLRASGYRPIAPLAILGAVTMAPLPLLIPSAQNVWTLTLFLVLAAAGGVFLVPSVYGNRVGSWALTVVPPLYVGLGLGYLSLLRSGHEGALWVLLVLVITWGYDTGAYAFGRLMGSRPFMAHVSPKKTVEGVGGGLLVAGLAALTLIPSLGLVPWQALVLGLAGGMVAQLGDLLESMVKRQAGLKDSGSIVPGHGGLLDRIDGLLFVSVAVYCGARAFGYAA